MSSMAKPPTRTTISTDTEPRTLSGYAQINVWRLGESDDPTDRTAASEIGSRLREQPGFRSYTVVRTGDHEVAAVTVFDSESQLRAALAAVADLVRAHVAPLAAGAPERRRGPVLHHHAVA
jgi:hypothetical protein